MFLLVEGSIGYNILFYLFLISYFLCGFFLIGINVNWVISISDKFYFFILSYFYDLLILVYYRVFVWCYLVEDLVVCSGIDENDNVDDLVERKFLFMCMVV